MSDFGERTVTFERLLNSPPDYVWRAWTNPDHLKLWFGPSGFDIPLCKIEPWVGGELYIVMRGPNGAEYPMKGVFREVVELKRLVFTNIALDKDGNHLLEGETRILLEPVGAKQTRMTMWSYAKGLVPISPQMLAGMEAGWSQSLDKLFELVNP